MINNFIIPLDSELDKQHQPDPKILKQDLDNAIQQSDKKIEQLQHEIANLNAQLDVEIAKKDKKFNIYQSVMNALHVTMSKKKNT